MVIVAPQVFPIFPPTTHRGVWYAPNFGQNFESFIIEKIIKGIQGTSIKRWGYYYYRTKNGVEIDLIIDGKFGVLPIEIKSGVSTTIKDLKSLSYFIDQQNLPIGIVINNDDKIIQIPTAYI